MKTPKNPMSKEAHEHFSKKLKRGEKFNTNAERKKMIKRCEMHDRGYHRIKQDEVERE